MTSPVSTSGSSGYTYWSMFSDWQDDRRSLRNYSYADSFIVEMANQAGDDEVQLD